jgi:hypothetical protein
MPRPSSRSLTSSYLRFMLACGDEMGNLHEFGPRAGSAEKEILSHGGAWGVRYIIWSATELCKKTSFPPSAP